MASRGCEFDVELAPPFMEYHGSTIVRSNVNVITNAMTHLGLVTVETKG